MSTVTLIGLKIHKKPTKSFAALFLIGLAWGKIDLNNLSFGEKQVEKLNLTPLRIILTSSLPSFV